MMQRQHFIFFTLLIFVFGLTISACHSHKQEGWGSLEQWDFGSSDDIPTDSPKPSDPSLDPDKWWKNEKDKPQFLTKRSTWNYRLSNLPYDELKLQFSDRLIQHLHDFGYANWGLPYYPPIKEEVLKCTMGINSYHNYPYFQHDRYLSYNAIRQYKEFDCPTGHPNKIRLFLYNGDYVLIDISATDHRNYCEGNGTVFPIQIKDNYIPNRQSDHLKNCFMIYKTTGNRSKCISSYYSKDHVEHIFNISDKDDIVYFSYVKNEDIRNIPNHGHTSLFRGTTDFASFEQSIDGIGLNIETILSSSDLNNIESLIKNQNVPAHKMRRYYKSILDCFAKEGSVYDKIDEYIISDYELPTLDGVKLYKRDHSAEDFFYNWGEWSVPIYYANDTTEHQNVHINTSNEVYKKHVTDKNWNVDIPVPNEAYPAGSMTNFCYTYFNDVNKGCRNIFGQWTLDERSSNSCKININNPPTSSEMDACMKLKIKLREEKAINLSHRDSHMAIVDMQARTVWEFYDSYRREDGSIEVANLIKRSLDDRMDLLENAPLANKSPSVRIGAASLLEGLVTRKELNKGYINHALAYCNLSNALHSDYSGQSKYALYGSRYDFYPALSMGGAFEDSILHLLGGFGAGWTGRNTLKPGMRLQLKNDFDCEANIHTPYDKTVCRALKEYGMIYVERCNGSGVYIEHIYDGPIWEDFDAWDDYRLVSDGDDELADKFSGTGKQFRINGLQMRHFRVVKPIKPPFFNIIDIAVEEKDSDIELKFIISLLIDADNNPTQLNCESGDYKNCTNGVPPFKGFAGLTKISLLDDEDANLTRDDVYCNFAKSNKCPISFHVDKSLLGSELVIKVDYRNNTINALRGNDFINIEYLDDVLPKYFPGNDEIDDVNFKLHRIQLTSQDG